MSIVPAWPVRGAEPKRAGTNQLLRATDGWQNHVSYFGLKSNQNSAAPGYEVHPIC